MTDLMTVLNDLLNEHRETANGVSLFLSGIAVSLCIIVTIQWSGRATREMLARRKTAMGWFAIGVFFSFAGQAIDNSYWYQAWRLFFSHSPETKWWFDNGVYPNILFRQACGIIGAYCHIRGFVALAYADKAMRKKSVMQLHMAVVISSILSGAMLFKMLKDRDANILTEESIASENAQPDSMTEIGDVQCPK